MLIECNTVLGHHPMGTRNRNSGIDPHNDRLRSELFGCFRFVEYSLSLSLTHCVTVMHC